MLRNFFRKKIFSLKKKIFSQKEITRNLKKSPHFHWNQPQNEPKSPILALKWAILALFWVFWQELGALSVVLCSARCTTPSALVVLDFGPIALGVKVIWAWPSRPAAQIKGPLEHNNLAIIPNLMRRSGPQGHCSTASRAPLKWALGLDV